MKTSFRGGKNLFKTVKLAKKKKKMIEEVLKGVEKSFSFTKTPIIMEKGIR